MYFEECSQSAEIASSGYALLAMTQLYYNAIHPPRSPSRTASVRLVTFSFA
jgi:hypothetical protein